MTDRKRVLFLIPSFIAGGAQRVFSTLLRHLDRDRFEIHLAVLKAKGEYMADLPKDIVLHDLKISRMRYAAPKLLKLIRKLKPDTILSTLAYLNFTVLMLKPFLPGNTKILVRESINPAPFLAAETKFPKLWRFLYRFYYHKADKVICLSDDMGEELANHFNVPRKKLVRIYNPVDFEMVYRMAAKDGNPFAGSGPFLITAARLERQKGLDILLEAMPLVVKKFPDVGLYILGDGPLRAELQKQALRLNLAGIRFMGFQENPWIYSRNADLFVFPSRYEGLPNALLEAMALGVPIVASDSVGGLRELQRSAKQMILVPPENPSALAQGIISALRQFKNCRCTPEESAGVLREFKVQQVVSEYSELL
jgi:glycosyltransferase involved in cell wall biosynthesis